MTDEEMFTDLKQFISAEIGQNSESLEKKIEKKFDEKIDRLEQKMDIKFESLEKKMDDGFEEVHLKIDTILDAVGTDISDLQSDSKDHEVRITKLETKVA